MRSYERLRTRRGRRRARGFRPTATALEARCLLAVITVTSTGDTIANDGVTTLREAITAANTNADPSGDTTPGDAGFDFINFDIPDTDPGRDPVTGVFTITLGAALPDIVETVTIDGYTQGTISTPGDTSDDATPNTLAVGNDARLLIVLNGGGGAFDGLVITAGGSAVRGLVINNFGGNAIVLRTGGGSTIAGNFLGTNAAGDAEALNGGGIFLDNSPSNQIGGSDPADRNVILGNTDPAIHTPVPVGTDPGDSAGGNTIQGNYIGVNAQGTAVLGQTGIYLSDGENQVGGTTVAQRNVISTQGRPGLFLDETGASDNTIEGNYIGVSADGTTALGNDEGIRIERGNGNFIGGPAAESRNVIVSGTNGIVLIGGGGSGAPAIQNNRIQGNFIGTNAAGDAALPAGGGGGSGVFITSGTNNTIGGPNSGDGNVIAGFAFGIRFFNAVLDNTGNLVQGNFIGTDAAGAAALPNSVGVALVASGGAATTGNTITGNVIAGNTSHGVLINGADGNLFQTNLIGVASDGTTALGNGGDGIQITSGSFNTIGGFTTGVGNTIANNGASASFSGIRVLAGTGNAILGNAIFDNAGLGIDLNGQGVTDNDDGDGDTGPNNLQNFPVLTTATIVGSDATIVGTFNSTASRSFRVEFFASAAADASGNGEGAIFLGFADVMTDGSGNAPINQPLTGLPAGVVAGMFIAATATDLTTNDTSEFAQSIALQAGALNEPDASVSKTASAGAIGVGQDLTYTIVVANAAGADDATTVVVTDTLPDNVEFVSATGDVTPVGGVLTFQVGTIAGGDSVTLTVVVRPLAAAVGTTITNTAAVASDVDSDETNNTSSADVSVLATPAADVSVVKTASADSIAVGQDLTYTIVVANAAGALDATTVVLTDTLPANVEFVSATGGVTPSNGVLTFDLGTLAGGASTTLTVVVRPLAAAAGATITNTATVASDIDSDETNNESSADVSVRAVQFDVGVRKTASTDSPRIGQDVTYTIVVTNDGPDAATGVVLTDTLPANATFVSATGGITPVGGVLTFSVDALANGASATFNVVVRPTGAPGVDLTNTAAVQAGAADNNPDNDTDTSTLTLLAALTDVSVTKTPSATSVQVGQELTYTIVVANAGPSQATGVTLTDVLPSGLSFVTSSAGSFDAATGTFTADLGTLGAGETRTITLVVQPTASAAGTTISNLASVTRAEDDSNAANDTSTASVAVSRVPTDTTPPVVLRVRRYGFHAQQTLLVLRFSERLDPRTALNRKSYFVRGQGPDHRLGTADDSTITVAAVAYDASTRTVTLRLRRRLYEFTNFRLFVRGTGRNAITDLAGNVLDGDRDGTAGGDASFLLNRKVIVGRANQAPLADQVGIPVPKASSAARLAAAHSTVSAKATASKAAASSKTNTSQANLAATADRLGAMRVALHDDAASTLTTKAKAKRR